MDQSQPPGGPMPGLGSDFPGMPPMPQMMPHTLSETYLPPDSMGLPHSPPDDIPLLPSEFFFFHKYLLGKLQNDYVCLYD